MRATMTTVSDLEQLRRDVAALLREHVRIPALDLVLERLPGDASNRHYYRARSEGQSYILMRVMDDSPAKLFEEKTEIKKVDELPFVNVHRFLDSIHAPVPKIHVWDKARGLMILEDWGDLMLEGVVREGNARRIVSLYEKSLDEMVKLQVQGTAKIGPECLAYHQRFNVALLNWEFDHFLEYGVEVREDRTMDPAEKATVRAVFDSVARDIESQPRVLTHRDFHCRNVMVHGNDKIGLIDFQDALMGPWTYDLASLVRDAYVTLGEDVVDGLIAYFLKKREEAGAQAVDPEEFRRQFDICSIQRNLKAAGRFVFIDVKKGNDKFLRHIPPVLGYVRRNLQKYEQLQPAFDVLQNYVPEFQV